MYNENIAKDVAQQKCWVFLYPRTPYSDSSERCLFGYSYTTTTRSFIKAPYVTNKPLTLPTIFDILVVSLTERSGSMNIEVTQVSSEYPLGTTDGVTYTIYPIR